MSAPEAVLLLLGLTASGLTACGPRGEAPEAARPGRDGDPIPGDSVPPTGGPSPPPAAEVAAPSGLLPGEGPPRIHQLLLFNSLDVSAFVFVAAGAGSVPLDTVPPRDSVRVDIRVRADIVRFEARDSGGILLEDGDLALERGSLNRWLIAPGSPGGVTAARPDSLF